MVKPTSDLTLARNTVGIDAAMVARAGKPAAAGPPK